MGPRFTRAEPRPFTGATLPDLISDAPSRRSRASIPGCAASPSRGTSRRAATALPGAAAGPTAASSSTNRRATHANRAYVLGRGIGITSLVARATGSAD